MNFGDTLWTLETFERDFQDCFERAMKKLWQKQEKYGRTYHSNTDVSYYLDRLKQEIEEYEKHPCISEANDIVNFALMISLHTKEGER